MRTFLTRSGRFSGKRATTWRLLVMNNWRELPMTGCLPWHAAEGRVLVTFDRGFANVIQHPPKGTAGIVVIRLSEQTLPRVRQVAVTLAGLLTSERVAGRLWVLNESRLRIWPRGPG